MSDRIILAFETSTKICSVAIIKGEDCISLKEQEIPRKHVELLPSFVKTAINESGQEIEKFDAVAVSIGPGSFTGLRIGLGFAKGFSFALGLPIIAVPTMEVMAYSLAKFNPTLGLMHSHGERIFIQRFSWMDKLPIPIAKPDVVDLKDLLDNIDGNEIIFQCQCPESISKNLDIIKSVPSAKWIGLFGNRKYNKLVVDLPYDLEPDYIAPFNLGNSK